MDVLEARRDPEPVQGSGVKTGGSYPEPQDGDEIGWGLVGEVPGLCSVQGIPIPPLDELGAFDVELAEVRPVEDARDLHEEIRALPPPRGPVVRPECG